MNSLEIENMLYEICEDERVRDLDFDLFESGVLDSLACIKLFSMLEDRKIEIYPTRIDRNRLRTLRGIVGLVAEYDSESE